MAQTAYEEAGMWAVKAYSDTKYKTLWNKHRGQVIWRQEQKCISYSNYESHTETQLQQWFSGFISKTTPYKFVKENWYGSLEETHISSTC
jgi:hypothetical protein